MPSGRDSFGGDQVLPALGRQLAAAGRQVQTTGRLVDPSLPSYWADRYQLAIDFRPYVGVSYGGTLLASGTTPPQVTITGTPSANVALYIRVNDVTGGTALGQAKFDWSIDGGATFVQTGQTTAASVVLGATGLTAAFAVGPYADDNIYKLTAAQWDDQGPGGYHLAQAAAASQPLYQVDSNGFYVQFDGTNDLLQRTNVNLFGTGAYTIIVALRVDSTVAGRHIFAARGTGLQGVTLNQTSSQRTITHFGVGNRSDGALTNNWEVWTIRRSTTVGPQLRVNTVAQSMSTTALTLNDAGATGLLCLGALDGPALPSAVSIAALTAFSTVLPDSVCLDLERGAIAGRVAL